MNMSPRIQFLRLNTALYACSTESKTSQCSALRLVSLVDFGTQSNYGSNTRDVEGEIALRA